MSGRKAIASHKRTLLEALTSAVSTPLGTSAPGTHPEKFAEMVHGGFLPYCYCERQSGEDLWVLFYEIAPQLRISLHSLMLHTEDFMKNTYEKPTLVLRERLATIVAAPVSSSPPPP